MQIYSKPNFHGLELEKAKVQTVANDASALTDEGQLSFTNDTKKLYIGNGTTAEQLGTSSVLVDGLIDGVFEAQVGSTEIILNLSPTPHTPGGFRSPRATRRSSSIPPWGLARSSR